MHTYACELQRTGGNLTENYVFIGLQRECGLQSGKVKCQWDLHKKREFLFYNIKKRSISQQEGFTGITPLKIALLLCLQTLKDFHSWNSSTSHFSFLLAYMFHIYVIRIKLKWMRECEKVRYTFPDASWNQLSHKNWYFKHCRSLDMSVNIDRNLSAEIMSQLWPRIYKATFHSFIKKNNPC